MKYANQLTEEELRELYEILTDSDAIIKSFKIEKSDISISLLGNIEIPEYEEEILKEDPNATIIIDDEYEILDYDVILHHRGGNVTNDYRKWMYKKFGNEYAKDFLLG